MKRYRLMLVFVGITLLIGVFWVVNSQKKVDMEERAQEGVIRYVAIGDSYTIGNGVEVSERWPNVLVQNLKSKGVDIELIANPAVSGYTVRNAIDIELPVIESLKPDYVTVLIGANDNFRGRSVSEYQKDLVELLDKIQNVVTDPKNIVLVTIPDYSFAPAARGERAVGVSKSIEEYNAVIKKEAVRRGMSVADIFPLSQTMTSQEDFIYDGLHPSALGYKKWEEVIFPVVLSQLVN